MIEAICDKCGKKIVLKHDEYGLMNPQGWNMVTQYFPINREVKYKIFCPECNHKMKEVKK